jgi:hypothetical protein
LLLLLLLLLLPLLAVHAPGRRAEHAGSAAATDCVALAAGLVCECESWKVQACGAFSAAVLTDVVALL